MLKAICKQNGWLQTVKTGVLLGFSLAVGYIAAVLLTGLVLA